MNYVDLFGLEEKRGIAESNFQTQHAISNKKFKIWAKMGNGHISNIGHKVVIGMFHLISVAYLANCGLQREAEKRNISVSRKKVP